MIVWSFCGVPQIDVSRTLPGVVAGRVDAVTCAPCSSEGFGTLEALARLSFEPHGRPAPGRMPPHWGYNTAGSLGPFFDSHRLPAPGRLPPSPLAIFPPDAARIRISLKNGANNQNNQRTPLSSMSALQMKARRPLIKKDFNG